MYRIPIKFYGSTVRMLMMKKKISLLTIGVFTLLLLLLMFFVVTNDELMRDMPIFQPFDMDVTCYNEKSNEYSFPRFDVGKAKNRLSSGRNIFFHETSCFNREINHQAVLNCRQACAVESAARANPKMSVNLLFLSPSSSSNRTTKLLNYLLSYDNVMIGRIYVNDYVKDTPLEKWYVNGVLESSRWPRSHMSDILRYLTLWKYGGIYLDLDVVVIKSLEDLTNFAGAEDHINVAAGFIGLSTDELGRRVADACLRDLVRNFRGNVWGNNGPGVITRTLKKLCDTKIAMNMTADRCNGFEVFPPSTFYPIFYEQWRRYFTSDDKDDTMRLIERAKAIHVWNKLSRSELVRFGSDVPYAIVAEKHCPKIYYGCGVFF